MSTFQGIIKNETLTPSRGLIFQTPAENVITIIRQKNTANDRVPLSELFPVHIDGMCSSITRKVIAPPVRAMMNKRIFGKAVTTIIIMMPRRGSMMPEMTPIRKDLPFSSP